MIPIQPSTSPKPTENAIPKPRNIPANNEIFFTAFTQLTASFAFMAAFATLNPLSNVYARQLLGFCSYEESCSDAACFSDMNLNSCDPNESLKPALNTLAFICGATALRILDTRKLPTMDELMGQMRTTTPNLLLSLTAVNTLSATWNLLATGYRYTVGSCQFTEGTNFGYNVCHTNLQYSAATGLVAATALTARIAVLAVPALFSRVKKVLT